MPAFMSVGAGYVRMLVVWTLFSTTSGYVMYKATRRRITGNTPRWVLWATGVGSFEGGEGVVVI